MNTSVIKRSLSWCLFVGVAGAVFYFMFRRVVLDWPLIAGYPWEISWICIILSVLLAIISMLFAIKAAHTLCIGFGDAISFPRFLYLFCITQLGRYLPGRIWHLLSLTILLEREKVRRSVAVALPVLFQGLMVAVFWLVGTVLSGAVVTSKLFPDRAWLVTLSVAAIVLALLFLPFLLRRLGGRYSKFREYCLPQRGYYGAVSLLALSGLALCSGFFLFASGLIDVALEDAPLLGGIFLLSYVFGWIIFIAPGGLGAREGALAFLLAAVVSSAVGNVVALAARLWMTVGECILFVGVWMWARFVRGERLSLMRSNSSADGGAV
jgi:hypothetical protein